MRRFSKALLNLYDSHESTPSFAERACAFLEELVPAEFIVLGSLDRFTQNLELFINRPVPNFEQAMGAFGEHMAGYELFRWDPEVNRGQPFFRSDYFSEREFSSTGMFSDVYRALGIDNHCAVLIPDTSKSIDFFGIERKGGPDFDEADRTLLEMAQDHLKNARALEKVKRDFQGIEARPETLREFGLSSREAEALYWISEGKSNDEIAMLLSLRLATVKGYVKTIFRKIGAPNRLSAALWALRVSHANGLANGACGKQKARIIARFAN